MTKEAPNQDRKRQIREQAHAARQAQPHKDEASRRIVGRLLVLPEYRAARTVQFYVDVRAEVRTRPALPAALQSGKRIVVPWCNETGGLELFRLESMDELDVGKFQVLEPRAELRTRPAKQVAPEDVDLVMAPGVGFDRRGGRLGHGKGYFDKLLRQVRSDAPLVALAFECQMFDAIPMEPHDVFMDKVITETTVYDGIGRSAV